jgi:hypothetical protein
MAHVDTHWAYGASGSATVTPPDGIADGDILLCAVMAGRASVGAITFPNGFSQIVTFLSVDSYERFAVAYKRASSESGNYVPAAASASVFATVGCYRGRIAAGDPVDVTSNTGYVTNDVNVRAASMTIATAGSDYAWFAYVYLGNSADSVAVPTGMAERAVATSGGKYRLFVGDLQNQSAGDTGVKTGTLGNVTVTKHAFMVALKPAVAATFKPRVILI